MSCGWDVHLPPRPKTCSRTNKHLVFAGKNFAVHPPAVAASEALQNTACFLWSADVFVWVARLDQKISENPCAELSAVIQ